MAQGELKVLSRQGTGKGNARSLRRQGLAPAVVYGKGIEPCAIALVPKELKKAIATPAGWNTLLTLQGEGAFAGRMVILKDMQVDAISRSILHADFQVIDRKTKINVMVPVHPIGKSVGEKDGGNLQLIRHELEVLSLPEAIPAAIEVDVTQLKIGDVVHIEDLVLPAGVTVPHDVNFTVITVTGHKAEEEAAAAAGEETV